MSSEEYESLLETLNILADDATMAATPKPSAMWRLAN